MIAAIGLRDHSGSAAAVALAGDPAAPRVVDRRRISLLEPHMPKEPYHAVARLPVELARKRLQESYDSALRCAHDELRLAVANLEAQGHRVVAMGGGVAGSPVGLPLERILKAHPLLHASEGELFRDVLAEAAAALGLTVRRHPWKDIWAELGSELGMDARERVHALGTAIGPPWAADQKEAAAAAWLALLSR